jgi:hypothetical protein
VWSSHDCEVAEALVDLGAQAGPGGGGLGDAVLGGVVGVGEVLDSAVRPLAGKEGHEGGLERRRAGLAGSRTGPTLASCRRMRFPRSAQKSATPKAATWAVGRG